MSNSPALGCHPLRFPPHVSVLKFITQSDVDGRTTKIVLNGEPDQVRRPLIVLAGIR